MNAHPSVISKICHHARPARFWMTIGSPNPVRVGKGTELAVPDALGTTTNSERHTPNPGMTSDDPLQFADTHDPARRTCVELEHERHCDGPDPVQLEQLESQAWQDELVLSKNCDFEHVGRHLPLVRTGLPAGQDEHWLKEGPEQLAQSGWHLMQLPEELNVLDGQVETH
ncbi:hypothetical protein D9613_003336 [Agrocybe pediades]|uniref:Uncharacterized protein n=1 Tax=Agrocybe pediades TaxID=84607 RepID=A0A8H4QPB9_9AGAR|nr:hypothetical protein D9613_003336 [Agrocybe pediades]